MKRHLSQRLQELRGRVSVEDLARQTEVSVSTVYKAEGGGDMRWETILKIYGRWLKDRATMIECLGLWAAAQSGVEADQQELTRVVGDALTKESKIRTGGGAASSGLTDARWLEFAALYQAHGWVREMVRTWLDLMSRAAAAPAAAAAVTSPAPKRRKPPGSGR